MKTLVKHILSIGLISSSLIFAGCDRSSQQPDFDQTLFQAQSYLTSGQIQSALIESQNLLRMQPDSLPVMRLMGDTFFTAGDYKSAREQYKKVLDGTSKNDDEYEAIFLKYIETLTHLGQALDAEKELDEYTKSHKEYSAQVNRLYGDIELVKGSFDSAIQFYTKSLDQSPQLPDSLLGLALAYNALGNNEKTLDWLNQAIDSKTDFTEALVFQGYYYINQKQPDRAEAAFSQAIATLGKYDIMTSQKYRAIHGLSKAYVDQGRTEEALRLNKTLADSPQGKVQQSLQNALQAYEQGDSGSAGEYFEEVLAISPENQLSNLGLGMIKLKQGDLEAAENLLSKASKDLEDINEDTLKALIIARLRLGKLEAAQDLLTKSLNKFPQNLDFQILHASLLADKKNFDQAATILEKVVQQDPKQSDALNLQAYIYQQQGNMEKARQAYLNSIAIKPDFLPSYQGLISSYEGKPREAQQAIQSILNKQGAKPAIAAEVSLAITHILNKDIVSARDLGRKLYAKAPQNPSVKKVLSYSLYASALMDYKQQRFQPSYIQLKEAMEVLPTPQMATLFTRLAVELQRPDEAVQVLQKLVKQYPKFSVGEELLGDLALANSNNPEALKHFVKAWESRPNFRLALKVFRLKQPTQTIDEAMAHIKTWHSDVLKRFKAEKAEPGLQKQIATELEASMFALTTVYEQNNMPEEAIAQYKALLKLQPKSPVYLNNLAWLMFTQNQADAVKYAEQAYKLAPEAGEIIDTYAWILVQTGQHEKGIELLQLAVKKSPNNTMIQKHLEEATAMKAKSI